MADRETETGRGLKALFWLLIAAGALLPLLLGRLAAGRAPAVSPARAAELLADPAALLVDVREPAAYARIRLEPSLNLPAAALAADAALAGRERLAGRRPVVVCTGGIESARAVRRLQAAGLAGAVSVAGGLDAWQRSRGSAPGPGLRWAGSRAGADGRLPRLDWSLFEQVLLAGTAFGLKPLYEILSLAVILVLWRSPGTAAAALRWGMLAFFLGENACAANFLLCQEASAGWEYLHSYGMLVGFALTAWAAMDLADRHLLRFSDRERPCALLGVCRSCYKRQEASCTLRWLFLVANGGLIVSALFPLALPVASWFFAGEVLGSPFVSGHSWWQAFFENRACPLLAALILLSAFLWLLRRGERGFAPAKALLAAGLGPLGFGLLRCILFGVYRDNPLWADVWEELSEFLFIAGLLLAAWIFRRRGQEANP